MGIKASGSKRANELQNNDWKFQQKICNSYEDCKSHERSAFAGRRSSIDS